MVRCNSEYCHRCNPPNSREISALKEAIGDIESDMPRGGEYYKDHEGEHYFPNMQWHDDAYEPWFQPLASAYEAGMKRALQIVQERRDAYKE